MGDTLAAEYAAQLDNLKINSKPMINALTMIAEDKILQAHIVVQTIERHLNRVNPGVKLPVLYLIDSIIKNVKKDYVNLFTQNIVSTFCGTFEKVDDKTKSQMFKLRQTWNDHIVQKKLYAIDLRCRQVDSNWPVTAPAPPASIHVNPRFLPKLHSQSSPKATPSPDMSTTSPVAILSPVTTHEVPPGDLTEAQMREQLLIKQKELLELQQKKLELELLQTKAKLEEEQNRKQIEAACIQQQQLMQMTIKAKHQTDVVASIIALAGPNSQFQPGPPAPAPQVFPKADLYAPDPRMLQQPMGEKLRAGGEFHSVSAKFDIKSSKSPIQKQKVLMDHAPVIPSPKTTSSSSSDSSPKKTKKREDDKDNRRDRSKDKHSKKDKERDKDKDKNSRHSKEKDSNNRRKKHDEDYDRRKSLVLQKKYLLPNSQIDREDEAYHSDSSKNLSRDSSRSDNDVKDVDLRLEVRKSPNNNVSTSPKATFPNMSTASVSKNKNMAYAKDPRVSRHSSEKMKTSPGSGQSSVIVKSEPTINSPPQKSKKFMDSIATLSASLSPRVPNSISPERSPSDKSKKNDLEDMDGRKDRLKDKHVKKEKDKERDKDNDSDKNSRHSKDKDLKDRRKQSNWNDYPETKLFVRKPDRIYRKNTQVAMDEDDENDETSKPRIPMSSDVDLRFETLKDVDLRTETESGEPPSKKSRPNSSGNNSSVTTGNSGSFIDDLFGREDVDLRQSQSSSSWSQVKKPLNSTSDDTIVPVVPPKEIKTDPHEHDEDIRDILQKQSRNRPPPPISPANSVGSNRSSCDPLGRPLLYNRLPDDPEERKRSLDTRSSSIDPVERFRTQHIDRAMHNNNGELTQADVKNAFVRAKEEVELGLLNTEQFQTIMKQLTQINEVNKIREVQMQQMRGPNWQAQTPTPPPGGPNPWTEAEDAWASFAPRGPNDFAGMNRFPVPTGPNTWQQPGPMPGPWGPSAVIPSGPRGPNPFEEAMPPMIIDDLIPVANPIEVRAIERDTGTAIPLDKVMRQVRFYGETAIVLMGNRMAEEPREISFLKDGRTQSVLINQKPMECLIGELKCFELNRKQHSLKLGAPTRELYIDKVAYGACFGGPPVRISLDGRFHHFLLKGPPPQVEVGKKPRFDLLAGRVNLIIDANQFSIYLDEKPQLLDLRGMPVVLRFHDDFHTVTLNGRPFPTNFGARLPFSVTVHGGQKHFLRFSAVTPETAESMRRYVHMKRMGTPDENGLTHFRGRGGHLMRGRGRGNESMRGRPPFGPPGTMPPPRHSLLPDPEFLPMEHQPFESNPLDVLVNYLTPPDEGKVHDKRSKIKDKSYESETSMIEDETENKDENTTEKQEETSSQVNVLDLLAKLMSAGLLPPTSGTSAEPEKESENVADAPKDSPNGKEGENEMAEADNAEAKEEVPVVEKPVDNKPIIPPLETVDIKFGEDSLKERRDKVVGQICTGVQCGSCGLRFAPDQTVRYSQHLDWHFRQNRLEKANARKAKSRKWYYDLSDWIQFEEIDDIETRAASLFEPLTGDDEVGANSPLNSVNPEDCTVLAKGHEGAVCPQCGETFDTFYDEDKEEWRLRAAVLDEADGESKLYHASCHQDYLKSLVEESILEVPIEEEAGANDESIPVETIADEDDDEVLILKEGRKEIVVMEIDVDDEDIVKERRQSQTMLDNLNTEKIDEIEISLKEKETNNEYLNVNESSKSAVPSPIVIHDIDEDSSSFLPGISDHTEEGVFQFALNEGRSRGNGSPLPTEEEKRIVYQSMKFDFPRTIKLEPEDKLEIEQAMEIDPFLSGKDPILIELEEQNAVEDIDLTVDDDSMDEVDSGFVGAVAEIDGNTQDTGPAPVYVPATKIRINISGVAMPSNSPSRKTDESDSQKEDKKKSDSNLTEENCEKISSPSSTGDTKVNSNSTVFTEEMQRLKPKLVGRKLVNCPPKNTGKEESGLCVIC